jgi:ATP sulfurylase
MSSTTPLLTDFPVLTDLPEKDLKDVLSDERLTHAILFTVPAVTTALAEQEKLGKENEEMASQSLSCSSSYVS